MYKLNEIIFVLILLAVVIYIYNQDHNPYSVKEGFKIDSQNFIYNNVYDVANKLEYGDKNVEGLYSEKVSSPMGPSSMIGVNENSKQDVYDNRGYKYTTNAKDPEIDTFTKIVDDKQLRQQFERTYMLDPDGSVAQYDPTYFKISPNCCPAQYAPPFKVTDKDESNCDYAQKYVANNYSGMNYEDGYGCVCMTPSQADFYGTRGGNST